MECRRAGRAARRLGWWAIVQAQDTGPEERVESRVVEGIRRCGGLRARGAALVCAASAAALLAAGCSATVDGSARPAAGALPAVPTPSAPATPAPAAAPTTTTATPTTPGTTAPTATPPGGGGALGELLPPASAFPSGYTGDAAVLPHASAVQASEDLSGVRRGARTQPVRCAASAQPPGPDDLAVMSSTRSGGRSVVAVQLERVPSSLDDYRDTLEACTEVRSNLLGAESTVTRTMLDGPSVDDAGEVVAFGQSVASGQGDVTLEQRSTTLAAQEGDVRILVTGMDQHGEPLGPGELSGLLSAAVQAVRAG